jgi:hypothetical protein
MGNKNRRKVSTVRSTMTDTTYTVTKDGMYANNVRTSMLKRLSKKARDYDRLVKWYGQGHIDMIVEAVKRDEK